MMGRHDNATEGVSSSKICVLVTVYRSILDKDRIPSARQRIVLRVTVELKNLVDLPKLVEGLKRLA